MDSYLDPSPELKPMVKLVPRPNVPSEVIAMRPDVTKVQGGATALFLTVVLGAPQAGYEGNHLDTLVIITGIVCAVAILADAGLRAARNLSDRAPIKP